jgi:hypothetical protein
MTMRGGDMGRQRHDDDRDNAGDIGIDSSGDVEIGIGGGLTVDSDGDVGINIGGGVTIDSDGDIGFSF